MALFRMFSFFMFTLLSFLLFAPGLSAQVKQSKADREREHQQMVELGKQTASALASTPSSFAWVDVSAAPVDFPAPVFRGIQTKMLRSNLPSSAAVSKYGKQLTLSTKDPAANVAQWYRQNLQAAGYKLDDKIPAQTARGNTFLIRAESGANMAMISIVSQDQPSGPSSQIIITVSPKRGGSAK